jgi:hypothetical protein
MEEEKTPGLRKAYCIGPDPSPADLCESFNPSSSLMWSFSNNEAGSHRVPLIEASRNW